LDTFELEVSELAMQYMYAIPEDKPAPNFKDYHNALIELAPQITGTQKTVIDQMIDRVGSFLNGPNGRVFCKDDNLVISDGITGVDFRPLIDSGSHELLRFYITFIGLRYAQKAYSNESLSTVLWDEIQECTRIAQLETVNLVDQIVRMGRKDAGGFDGISQEVTDINLGPATLKQISRKSLLYMDSGHEEVADYFPKIPKRAIDIFSNYEDPEKLDYRQGIRSFGKKTHDIRYMFPQSILDLGDTFSPKTLTYKKEIAEMTSDPLERLRLYRERMQA